MAELKPGWYYHIRAKWVVGRLFNVVEKKEERYKVSPSVELYTSGILYVESSYLNTWIEDDSVAFANLKSEEKYEIIESLLGRFRRIVD